MSDQSLVRLRDYVSLFWLLFFICLLLFSVTVAARADFSGSTRLQIAATPVPCSIDDPSQGETPCEITTLRWNIKSIIDLHATLGGIG